MVESEISIKEQYRIDKNVTVLASLEQVRLRAMDQLLSSNKKENRWFTKTPPLPPGIPYLTPSPRHENHILPLVTTRRPCQMPRRKNGDRLWAGAQKIEWTGAKVQSKSEDLENCFSRAGSSATPITCPASRKAWYTTFCNFFFIIFFNFSLLFFKH